MYKSITGGISFEQKLNLNCYKILIDPDNHNILYLGVFGEGIYKATNAGNTSCTINCLYVLGSEIETVVNEKQKAGSYSIEWEACDYPSGVYYYHIVIHSNSLSAGNFAKTKKMVLVK